MDDIVKSIRSIVSESNVNIVTKRMIRHEYARRHNMPSISPQLREAISQVLNTIVQELRDLMKLELLKQIDNVEYPEADQSKCLNTPLEIKDLSTDVVQDKANPTEVVKHKANPTEAVKDNAYPTEAVKDNANPTEVVKDNANPTEVVKDNANPTETVKDNAYPTESVKDNINPTEAVKDNANQENFHETQPSRLQQRSLKMDTLKKKLSKVFSADEARKLLMDSDSQNSQDVHCLGSFSPLKGPTFGYMWDEDISLLSTFSDSDTQNDLSERTEQILGHDCEERFSMGLRCFEVSPRSPESSEVIVIDSSPEKNYPNQTRSRSEDRGRTWLSLFSDEDQKAIKIDDRLLYDRDSCHSTCDVEPAQARLSRKCEPKNSNGTIIARSPVKKKMKNTTLSCKEGSVIDDAMLRNDQTFHKIDNTSNSIFYNSHRRGREIHRDAQVDFRNHSENLWVSVRLTPMNADNVETIIDLTK